MISLSLARLSYEPNMASETWLRRVLSEHAYGLAALRIVVVAMLLITPELQAAPALAAAPERLVASPEGVGWMAGFRFPPGLVGAARLLAYSAGACALLGYWSRLSCAVLTVAATFLLSFAERVGATLHAMHMLWLLALLASSRCGDVWSLDAWGRAAPAPSIAYGVPLCLARSAPSVGLVVEVDGGVHCGSRSADRRRDENLRRLGYRVVRVNAGLVLADVEAAAKVIAAALA